MLSGPFVISHDKMTKHVISIAAIPAMIITIASCSIREDRSACQDIQKTTMLRLDLRSCAPDYRYIHLRVYDPEGIILQKTIRTDSSNPYDTTTVHLQDMRYTLWASKSDDASIPLTCVNLLENIPSDSIYADYGELYTIDAPWTERPVLHKQFMTIILSLNISRNATATIEYPNSGISFHLLEPTGPARVIEAAISEDGMASVRLTRQKEGSRLLLRTPSMKDALDLGRILKSLNYNWNAPDLHDILLEIDEGNSSFQVSILPWDRGCDMSLRLPTINAGS